MYTNRCDTNLICIQVGETIINARLFKIRSFQHGILGHHRHRLIRLYLQPLRAVQGLRPPFNVVARPLERQRRLLLRHPMLFVLSRPLDSLTSPSQQPRRAQEQLSFLIFLRRPFSPIPCISPSSIFIAVLLLPFEPPSAILPIELQRISSTQFPSFRPLSNFNLAPLSTQLQLPSTLHAQSVRTPFRQEIRFESCLVVLTCFIAHVWMYGFNGMLIALCAVMIFGLARLRRVLLRYPLQRPPLRAPLHSRFSRRL